MSSGGVVVRGGRWATAVRGLMGGLMVLWLALAVVAAPTSAAASWTPPTGELGWCGLNHGGTCTYFGTPNEACYWQFTQWAQNAAYDGYVDSQATPTKWNVKNCKWHQVGGIGPAPAATNFICASGYSLQAPEHCVKTGEDFPAFIPRVCPTCRTPHPIDILNGNKTFRADDFTTADGGLSLARSFNSLAASGAGASIGSLPLGL